MLEPKTFVPRPLPVTAIQWTGENRGAIEAFAGDSLFSITDRGEVFIKTSEGTMRAEIDHWIVKGHDGRVWCVDPTYFATKYQEAA